MVTLSLSEIKILQKSVLFSGYHDDELSSVLSLLKATKSEYKKGEYLHMAGTPLPAFGMVLAGVVQACHDDLSGRRCIMAEVPQGQTFGESLSFLSVKDSLVYITAATDCTVLWLTIPTDFVPDFSKQASSFSEKDHKGYALSVGILQRLTTLLSMRTLSMNSRIQVLSRPRLRDKILLFLQEQAEVQGSPYVNITMNRDDLASFIGADRSALSRELSKMKAEGIIDYYKNSFRLKDNEFSSK